mgnify:FL=1
MSTEDRDIVVEMTGITKYFPGVLALDKVNLCIKKGEVLALLGENGAGKSTLMRILYGMYRPDEGQIRVNGRIVNIESPRDVMKLGIGMIHQHFTLVPVHSVVENVILGAITDPRGSFSIEETAKEKKKLGDTYGLEVDPFATVNQLPVEMQQRVEILKALYRGANVLIMDEPTAVLTPQSTEMLFNFIRDFRKAGNSVIFISHKLNEVLEIADRIAVLRSGRVVGEVPREKATEQELARMMVGHELGEIKLKAENNTSGKKEPILCIENLKVRGNLGHLAVDALNLEIFAGEIHGIAGVSGNGQDELTEALYGLRPVSEGNIFLNGTPLTKCKTRNIIDLGVGYIPADRHKEGLVLDMSVEENLVLKGFDLSPFSRKGILQEGSIRQYATQVIESYAIKTPTPDTPVRYLSGGNQQKVVIAREIAVARFLLIAVQPTRGLDIGSTEYVHQILLKARNEGRGVLLISTELSEILSLSDRISVIYRGRILKTIDRQDVDMDEIGLLMMGVTGRQ